ncbi:MAG: branched-chain amino acid ABC transporter substrate-binding protein [Alphaproteobacteria bacterium]|nr:branched-chain amino acid ABC transporter substrate-binding protein [Alphaproteobacteria bacterium]
MRYRTLFLLALTLFSVPVLAATEVIAGRAVTTVGVIAPLTGQYAVFGEQIKRGAEQAAKDMTGFKLRLADDACDPKQAVTVANQMVAEGVQFVIGHYCSGSAIPASKVFIENGVLLISPGATNPKLTDEADTFVFRVCGRDDRQGEVIGNFMLKHHAQARIALINDKSAYGRGLADEVKRVINAGGIKETLFESYNAGERDYRALVSKLKESKAEVLFIGGYHTEAGLIARQLAEQGAQLQIFGGDALVTDEFWSIAGKAGEGVLMSFGPDPRNNPAAQQAVAQFRQQGYEPEGYTLYTYAAFQALEHALAQPYDKFSPGIVARALRAQPAETVLGKLGFDAKGDVQGNGYVLYRWHDGKYAEIKE